MTPTSVSFKDALFRDVLIGIDKPLEQSIRDRVALVPIMSYLDISMAGFAPGVAAICIPYKKTMDGLFDCFHGGLLAAAADTVACFAVMTVTGPDQMMTTTDLNIRYLAPCTQDLIAVGKTIKVGKTLCPVTVDLYEADSGKHVAVATVTYMRLPGLTSR